MAGDRFDTLDFGSVKIVDVRSWWRKALIYLSTPALNLALRLLSNRINKEIASVVSEFG